MDATYLQALLWCRLRQMPILPDHLLAERHSPAWVDHRLSQVVQEVVIRVGAPASTCLTKPEGKLELTSVNRERRLNWMMRWTKKVGRLSHYMYDNLLTTWL